MPPSATLSGWQTVVLRQRLCWSLCIGALSFNGCGGGSPAAPTASEGPSTPPIRLRLDEGLISARSGTNLSEPPWLQYASCGEVRNVSDREVVWRAEMTVYGPEGGAYVTEALAGQVPRRFSPGGFSSGCGGTTVRDYDSSHLFAISYRLRVIYTRDDGSTGSVEAEAAIRPSLDPEVRGVVINEFRARGPRGDQDQFIELRNITGGPILMDGWFVQVSKRSFDVEVGTISRLGDGVTLNPGCHFLLTALVPGSTTPGSGTYSGSVPGNVIMFPFLSDTSGIALRTRTGQVVDQVGMSTNTVFKEGSPLPPFGSANTDRSYSRVGPDLGDNAVDFQMQSPSTPRNSRESCR